MKRIVLLLALLTTFLALVGSASAVGIELNNYRYSDAPNPDDRYHAIDVVMNGELKAEEGIVELGLIDSRDYLTWYSGLRFCDSEFPYNVHGAYKFSASEPSYDKIRFTLTGRNIPDGTYKAYFVHYTSCAKDGGVMKEPKKFVILKEPVVFGKSTGNILDQCDNEYEAMQYLKSKGVLNCRVASCVDSASSSSKAVCSVSGECNTGSVQSQTCSDGSTINVRECVNANWVSTGITCPSLPVPPLPPPVTPPKAPVNLLGWGLVGVAVFAGFFVLRRFGVVRF